jgi:hypothetical protein
MRVTNRLSRVAAPLLGVGALVATLSGGATAAVAAPAAPGSGAITVSGQHWDDDYDDDWDRGYRGYRHRHHWDDDLDDYPYCDRRGNGYGCPEYGYPPEW